MPCFDCAELRRLTRDSSELCGKCWVKAHPGESLLGEPSYDYTPPVLCMGCREPLSMYDEERGRCDWCYQRFVNREGYEDFCDMK